MDAAEARRIKILLLGHAKSGKTALMMRYFKNMFEEEYTPTPGSNMASRKFNYKKSQLDVEVLEIGGKSINSLMAQPFHGRKVELLSGAAGLVFLFDCTDKESFQALEEWIDKTEGFLDVKGLVGVVTATKADLERVISEEEAKNFARMKKLVRFTLTQTYFSTSAKTGSGIERLFLYVINQVVECSKDRLSVINKEHELQKNSIVLKSQNGKRGLKNNLGANGGEKPGGCC